MVRFIVISILMALLIFISPILLIGGVVLFDYFKYPSQVRALIPEKVETREVASNDFSEQIGGGGDCGGLAFRLSEKTVNEIKEQGLDYFKDMTFPIPETNYSGKKDSWRAWRKAPVPEGESKWANLVNGCDLLPITSPFWSRVLPGYRRTTTARQS